MVTVVVKVVVVIVVGIAAAVEHPKDLVAPSGAPSDGLVRNRSEGSSDSLSLIVIE